MKKIIFFAVALFALVACKTGLTQVNDVSVTQFERFIQQNDVQLVDVRTPEEFAEGHIKGAININVKDANFVASAEKQLRKSKPVAVYCRSGKRSAMACALLKAKGFKTTNLLGGILGWQSEGKAVEK